MQLRKAPENYRNSPDFLRYMRWEESRYHFSEQPRRHFPSEEKLLQYYRTNDILRTRLCRISKFPASAKKDSLVQLLYQRIDENMGRIFHARNPEKWPDPDSHFVCQVREKKEKQVKVIKLVPFPRDFPPPINETILTGTYAHHV